jgi:ribosomal protein L21
MPPKSQFSAKPKETIGEQVRRIADRLKQETNVQIKVTSRILGAAAKISENHEKLIDEVVEMVEEDLEKSFQAQLSSTYTVAVLKKQFKTLSEAKFYFGIPVKSWVALVDQLNNSFAPKQISMDDDIRCLLRLPCKFIKGESDTSSIIISAIADELKRIGRNVLPVIVKQSGEDKYQVILNDQIVAAARQAKLDFVWCIIVDNGMENQLQVETGKVVRTNLQAATEKELTNFFEFIQTQEKGFSKIQPPLVAKAVVEYRQANSFKDLNFLTKLKCGIGKTKLPQLKPYIILE